ncbi:MAG: type 1 glutamine amidotransferase [Candidatus Aquicultor sp.]
MEKFLVILENDDVAAEQNLSLVMRRLVAGKLDTVIFEPISGFPDDVPQAAAGLIVGGGLPSVNDSKAWIEDEIRLIRRAASLRLPVLGICFGHQLIGKAFGSEVVRRERRVGFADVVKVQEAPIFDGLPPAWKSAVYHQDRIETLPQGFKLIASSQYCAVQAMAHADLPIWTTQFHPEIQYGINEHFADPVEEWNDEAAFDSVPNKRLIDNFVELCLSTERSG